MSELLNTSVIHKPPKTKITFQAMLEIEGSVILKQEVNLSIMGQFFLAFIIF